MFKSILLIAVSFAVSESQFASAPRRVRGDNAIVGGQNDALFGRGKSNLRYSNKERDLQEASMSMPEFIEGMPAEEEVSEGIEPASFCGFPILCSIPLIGSFIDCTSC